MQDYTVFPELGIKPAEFWKEVKATTAANEATEVLTYMRLMADRIVQGNLKIDRARLTDLGARVPHFDGVDTWFDRINKFVLEETSGYVKLRHYIVSAGLKEILEGVSIAPHFHTIFAS